MQGDERQVAETGLDQRRRRGVQHHVDHAFDVTIHRHRGADVNAQMTGDGREQDWTLRVSPSISLVLTTSSVNAARLA